MINHIERSTLAHVLGQYNVEDRLLMLAIRSKNRIANEFDDTIALVFNNNIINIMEGTCDPGTPNLVNPVNKDGAAIVVNGHYKGMFRIGLHRGKYLAFVQNNPVAVFRDDNRDNILDIDSNVIFNDGEIIDNLNCKVKRFRFDDDNTSYITQNGNLIQYGMFGINGHRASLYHDLLKVGLYSAGCLVVRKHTDYFDMMDNARDMLETLGTKEIDVIYVNEDLFIN